MRSKPRPGLLDSVTPGAYPLWVWIGLLVALFFGVREWFQGEPCPECGEDQLCFEEHSQVGQGHLSRAVFVCRGCGVRVSARPDGPWEIEVEAPRE